MKTRTTVIGWTIAAYCTAGSLGVMFRKPEDPRSTPPMPAKAWAPWELFFRLPAIKAVFDGKGLIFRVSFPRGLAAEWPEGLVNSFQSRFVGECIFTPLGQMPPPVPDFPPDFNQMPR